MKCYAHNFGPNQCHLILFFFDIKDKMYNELRLFITQLLVDRTDIYRCIDNPKSITYRHQIVRAMSIVISTTIIKSSSSSEVISAESSSSTGHNYHHYSLSSRISIIIIIRSRISEIIIIIVTIVNCPEESSSSFA